MMTLCVTAPAWGYKEWLTERPLAAAIQDAATWNSGVMALLETKERCAECHRLNAETLRDPVVRQLLEDYELVAYDARQGEGRHVIERYNVVVYPTLLYLGPDGQERGRLTGFHPTNVFAAELRGILDGTSSMQQLEQQLKQTPGDLAFQLHVGVQWALRGADRALVHLDQVARAAPPALASQALLAKGDLLLLRSLGDARAAQAVLRQLQQRFPGTRAAREAANALAVVRRWPKTPVADPDMHVCHWLDAAQGG